MLTLYDFKCETCGNVDEVLIQSIYRTASLPCKSCGLPSVRLISPIRSILEGHSGHFPDAAEKWAKRHEKEGRKPSETDPRGW
jgi:predicted nucleic acid-binding Zn ribbon protein